MDTVMLMMLMVLQLAIAVLVIGGIWQTFTKAGQYGWAIFIPIYNLIVLLRVAGKPWWWIFLCMIPFVNIVLIILIYIDVAKNFGKSALFGVGLIFLGPIFFPILGWGSAQYIGEGSPGQARGRYRDDYRDDRYGDEDDMDRPRGRSRGDSNAFEEDRPRSRSRDRDEYEPAPSGAEAASPSVQCDNCGRKLRVPSTAIGKRVKCAGCGDVFVA